MMSKQNVPELRFPEFSGEWREHTWKDIGEYKKSYSFSRAHEGEGLYRHIHYGDIHSKLPSIIKSSEILPRISTSDDLETVSQGDILIADASEDYKDLGKTVLVKTQESEIVSGLHTIRFRPINNIDSTFLLYFTKSISYRKFITKMGTGVSVLGLSKTNLAKLKINLPEIEEQKKIGEFFRKLDRLIELEEKKLELLEEQKKGYMQKIFSQELRFKDEDGNDYPEWEEKKLVNISKIQNGYAFKSSKFKEKGNRIIRISDIQNNMITNGTAFYPLEINISSLFKVEKNDILIAMSGATTGKVGKYTMKEPSYLNQRLGKFVVTKDADREFLFTYLLTDLFHKKLNGLLIAGAQPNLSSKDIESIKLFVPSIIEQVKIGKLSNNFHHIIQKQTKKIEILKTKKRGFINKMFI